MLPDSTENVTEIKKSPLFQAAEELARLNQYLDGGDFSGHFLAAPHAPFPSSLTAWEWTGVLVDLASLSWVGNSKWRNHGEASLVMCCLLFISTRYSVLTPCPQSSCSSLQKGVSAVLSYFFFFAILSRLLLYPYSRPFLLWEQPMSQSKLLWDSTGIVSPVKNNHLFLPVPPYFLPVLNSVENLPSNPRRD